MIRPSEEAFDAALDAALLRALPAPTVTASFRARLRAAVQRAGQPDKAVSRQALAAEYERQIQAMRADHVRLQRRTLGTLLGAAFVSGIALTLALPWIRAQFGDLGLQTVALVGAVTGVVIGARSWLRDAA